MSEIESEQLKFSEQVLHVPDRSFEIEEEKSRETNIATNSSQAIQAAEGSVLVNDNHLSAIETKESSSSTTSPHAHTTTTKHHFKAHISSYSKQTKVLKYAIHLAVKAGQVNDKEAWQILDWWLKSEANSSHSHFSLIMHKVKRHMIREFGPTHTHLLNDVIVQRRRETIAAIMKLHQQRCGQPISSDMETTEETRTAPTAANISTEEI